MEEMLYLKQHKKMKVKFKQSNKNFKKRKDRTKQIEEDIRERESKRENIVDQCTTLQSKVEAVSSQLHDLVSNYKNLKVKLPEMEKTFQQDTQSLDDELINIKKLVNTYNIILENFIPQPEIDRLSSIMHFDQDTQEYYVKDPNKKTILTKVTQRTRPNSCHGQVHPTSISEQKKQQTKDFSVVLKPIPLDVPLLENPQTLDFEELETEIEDAFEEGAEADLEVDIPAVLPTFPLN